MRVSHREKNSVIYGITTSLTRRKIQKCQRKLGNGHDAELHLTVADLYKYLGEQSLALESYQAAAASVLQKQKPLDAMDRDRLISTYKRILALSPLDEDTANRLGQEYLCRGMDYRAISLHTLLAERYVRQEEYRKAIEQYQRVVEIEPGSITARVTCASLHCQLGDPEQGSKEYAKIGDIFFEHLKFDGALEYYQQALELDPQNEMLRQKAPMTKQILEGTLVPEAQANLQKLNMTNQESVDLKRDLAEKDRIEQELRKNLVLLKQRYQQSEILKNEELQVTRERLEELSTYVAVFKDNLEKAALEKQRLQQLLDDELAHKRMLEQKLKTLGTLDPQTSIPTKRSENSVRLESAVTRLGQEKINLEQQLQKQLAQSSTRELQLRNHLEQQTSKGATLRRQFIDATREREHIEQQLRQQLRESLQREQRLQDQMKQLIGQHEQALKQVEREKQAFEKKYRKTRTRMNIAETRNINTLEQLHGELTRQCQMESGFSEQFHNSIREITRLLHNQEQEIQKLERLYP